MIQDWFADVVEFMRAAGQQIGTTPKMPDHNTVSLHRNLILEEHRELMDAIVSDDLTAITKESIDLIYVVLDNLAACGIDPAPIWNAVHGDNMRKTTGPKRADGKQLKPEGYKPTDIRPILDCQPPINDVVVR